MCGIIGYIGKKDAYPILINGLKRLEYRGYDSSGIALINGQPKIYKIKGKVSDLENFIEGKDISGHIGIAHTRWATHGEPNDINAHPHISEKGHFILIHNGIIENYTKLKKRLEDRGYHFKSETDTEVLVNLIEYIYLKGKTSVEIAVRLALTKVIGAYGILVISKDEPKQLIAARNGSPLVIGLKENEYFFASDATPIIEYTKSVIYMNDGDFAIIKEGNIQVKTLHDKPLNPRIQKIDLDLEAIEKGGYEHFMLKEIFEQPKAIQDTFRGRLSSKLDNIYLGGLHEVINSLTQNAIFHLNYAYSYRKKNDFTKSPAQILSEAIMDVNNEMYSTWAVADGDGTKTFVIPTEKVIDNDISLIEIPANRQPVGLSSLMKDFE